MTYNLFDLTYRVARELGEVMEGSATGGDTTSIIDTVWLAARFNDDHFNAGTAWILYDAGGASAAPEGEWARVTDFDKTGGDATITAVTVAVASGDRYALATAKYTRDTLIQAVNKALDKTPVPTTDTTTIDTASSKTEYDLPTGVLDENIRVFIQRVTDDTDDNRWIEYYDWYIQDTATGTAQKIVFRTQPPYAYDIKVVYWIPHPPLYARADKLRESVDVNRIVHMAVYEALLWKRAQSGTSDPDMEAKIQDALAKMHEYRWASPSRKQEVKLATLGFIDVMTDEDTTT
jgi:hypothetical protein